ncbi:MAG: hypothetical protein ACM3ZQ_08335, partial [Bacillota bacterium]
MKKKCCRHLLPLASVILLLAMVVTGCQQRTNSQPPSDTPAPTAPAPTASNASEQQPEKPAADDIVLSDRYFIKHGLFA